jgi:hypothetical protein
MSSRNRGFAIYGWRLSLIGGLLHPVDSDNWRRDDDEPIFAIGSFLLWRTGDHLTSNSSIFGFTNASPSRFAPGDSLMLAANRRAAEFKATNGLSDLTVAARCSQA